VLKKHNYFPRILSFKNFCNPSLIDRFRINRSIEKNYKNYLPTFKKNPTGYNFPIERDHTKFFHRLYEGYLQTCYDVFGDFELSSNNSKKCWCYKSNKKDSKPVWHSHFDSSTINGVYYYQIEDSDGTYFKDANGIEQRYMPDQGELIIFQNYVIHKPHIPTLNRKRYTINMETLTKESVHELFGRLD
tara:strand:- start:95 stop:658 length:564 start_codon:yes stop_codon:yes gene_type:complete